MVEAVPHLISEKAIRVFGKHQVLSETELHSRYEIFMEQYIKHINIEAQTMIDMTKRLIIPAVIKYITNLAVSIDSVKNASACVDVSTQMDILNEVSQVLASLKANLKQLEMATDEAKAIEEINEKGICYHEKVCLAMNAVRADGDTLETIVDGDLWPLPTYAEMLFML